MKVVSAFIVVVLGMLSVSACADTRYYAVYWHDIRIGYYRVTTSSATYEGKPAIRTQTHFEDTIVYLGRKRKGFTDTDDLSSQDNKPLREHVTSQVFGRTTWRCDFKFDEKSVEIDQVALGKKLRTTLPLPSSPIYYDEQALISQKCPNPGDSIEIPHFRAGLGEEHPAFVPVQMHTVGYADLKIEGKPVKAIHYEEKNSDSPAGRDIYISPSGENLRFEYPAESLVYAITSKELALSPLPNDPSNRDFFFETATWDQRASEMQVDQVDQLAEMRILIENLDLSKAPSDESQTVVKGDLAFHGPGYDPANRWSIDIHPAQIADSVPETIEDAVRGQEQWTKPGKFMPSDDPKIKALAAKIVGNQKTVVGGVLAIKNYVGSLMEPKTEFGAARDALQILHDRTGTGSNYSILTTTLLRAAGIAARPVSGVVTWDDHGSGLFMDGWAEAWDGRRWIGVDATERHAQLSACHIKLWEDDLTSGQEYQHSDLSKVRFLVYYSHPYKK
jgi:hypothetical protein